MESSGAFAEAVVFLDHFEDLADPRQRGKVVYPLDEVLLLCLLAVLAGADSIVDIARFGDKERDLLRRFRPFSDGTPSHDQLGTILAILDARMFQQCFVAWVAAITGVPGEVIAIDGKTSRRSYQKTGAKAPIHMVSAFAARQRLVLGQVKVAEKSNEIIAIPDLLDMLAIDGAIVTLDAMGCQREIATKIVDKKADYVLALKANQTSLHEAVELFVDEQKANGFNNTKSSQHTSVGGDHGRIETRRTTVSEDIAWLQQRHGWPGLAGAGRGWPGLAGAEIHHRGRKHARDRRQDRARDPTLHLIARSRGGATRPNYPLPLGDREQLALGHGHGLSR